MHVRPECDVLFPVQSDVVPRKTDARLKSKGESTRRSLYSAVCLGVFKSSIACGSRVAFVPANEIEGSPS